MTTLLRTVAALRGIRHSYGEAEVLHGIDLDLPAGQLVALLGPSGSGKTLPPRSTRKLR